MPAKVVVIAGPAGSGKTAWLLERYRHCFRPDLVGTALWISPTHRSAAEVRGQLLSDGLRACFAPAVMTFSQFAERVLAASDRVVQPISDLVKRQLVRRLILIEATAGRLAHFRSIAATPGLVDLATEFISELKRYEIWPEHFERACRARGWQPKDRDLLALYHGYQDQLNQQQLYDAEGRFWTARELLRDELGQSFARLEHVVVDGFTDFTRTQHEILAILGRHVAALHIALPIEAGSERADLFAKPRRTLERLQDLHQEVEVVALARAKSPPWAGLAHVETELFKNPRQVRPATNVERIEVIEAARAIDEMYLIGRRIKRLLVGGDPTDGRPLRPGDVAVVLRSPAALATLVREAFDDLGLPYHLDEARPLSAAPIAAGLVALVRLHVDDWPFRGLLGLLMHNYFAPDWPQWRRGAAAAEADRAIRALEIARGRAALLAALDRPEDEQTRALLERLAAALDRLPREATLGQWAKSLIGLATETGLLRAAQAANNPVLALDRAAWDLIIESLVAIERVSIAGGRTADRFDARELLELLTDIVGNQRVKEQGDEVGRVRVLSATSARTLSIPYLFFAGLSERAFPPPERADRLYNEAEYERLVEAGLPLVLRAEASQEEMLLFYEVVTRARRHLYLSYPGLDDKGQPLLPSPYLTELEHVCGDQVQRFGLPDLSPLPRDEDAASAADQRILAVAQAVGAPPATKENQPAKSTAAGGRAKPRSAKSPVASSGLLAGLANRPATRAVYENILAGLVATDSRAAREGFGPFEGMLSSPAARAQLAAHFTAEERWSASRLEQYGSCPFQYFLEQVLQIEPLEGLTLATDSLARGSSLHAALARLHREVNDAHGGPVSPAAPAGETLFRDAVTRLLTELARAAVGRLQPFQAALAEIDRRVIASWLAEYPAQHAAYDELAAGCDDRPRPSHFEVSFGESQVSDDPLSTPEPLPLYVEGQRILIRGRIDRIDLGQLAGAPVFTVLDYKSGRAKPQVKRAIAEGEALQVSLYTLAVEHLLARDGHLPWSMGYWFVSDGGYKKNQALVLHEPAEEGGLRPTDDWQAIRALVAARVGALVAAIRAGSFPVASRDEHCTSYCAFNTVCRVNQVRSLEKTWDPQAPQA